MFINYSHPSELKDRAKRRKVSHYAAKPAKPRANLASKHRPGTFQWRRALPSTPPDSNDGTPAPPSLSTLSTSASSEEETVEEVVRLPTPPLETWTYAGTRGDPFNAFPIQADGLVPLAIDYYKSHYVPANDFIFKDLKGRNPMISQHFPEAMQSAVEFEGLVLLMTAHSKSAFGFPHLRERALAMHRASVIQQLNKRLQDPRTCADDVTLHVTVSLLAADVCYLILAGRSVSDQTSTVLQRA